jgi:hypothetical protein
VGATERILPCDDPGHAGAAGVVSAVATYALAAAIPAGSAEVGAAASYVAA